MTEFQQAVAVSVIVFGLAAAWQLLGVCRYLHGRHLARTYWSGLSPAMKRNHNSAYVTNQVRRSRPEVTQGFGDELTRLIRTYENVPEGATHYNEPFYYKVVNGSCQMWLAEEKRWVSCAWDTSTLPYR